MSHNTDTTVTERTTDSSRPHGQCGQCKQRHHVSGHKRVAVTQHMGLLPDDEDGYFDNYTGEPSYVSEKYVARGSIGCEPTSSELQCE